TLYDFLDRYGRILCEQARNRLEPLHVPGRDFPAVAPLLRNPFDAQAHVTASMVKALQRQKAIMVVAERGSGKTMISLAALHTHANRQPYRALVMCPGQLTKKWEREIIETIPGAKVQHIENYRELAALWRSGATAPMYLHSLEAWRGRMDAGPQWF